MAQSFGRRPLTPTTPHRATIPAVKALPQRQTRDLELEDWKKTRARSPLPWRQIYLMAGLCFGMASLVLPDSVNHAADWLLYALMAASFYAGWRRKRERDQTSPDR